MCAKMETNESRPKAVKYVCEQGEHSKFYLKETDSKADETQVESSNDNLNSEERNTGEKKSPALSQSGTGIAFLKDLTETPTDIKAEQPKVESSNHNKSEPLKHIKRNTWKKKRTVRNEYGTGIEQQRKRIFCIFLKGKAGKNKSNVWLLLFLTFSAFDTPYGLDLQSSIETSPIIFGKDATFQCSYKGSTSLASLKKVWLKGHTKENIIYSNTSTNDEKYTPEIYLEADRYIYRMIIHNVSLSDLDTYICQFGFNSASLTFTMGRNLSFIYFPGNNDVVYNISKTKMNVLIERIFPQPNCTALYNDENITISMELDNHETTYSTQMQMDLRECNGNLYISCILGSMSFNLTKRIQQCSDGMESSTLKQELTGLTTAIIAIVIISTIAAVIIVTVIGVHLCGNNRSKESGLSCLLPCMVGPDPNSPDPENARSLLKKKADKKNEKKPVAVVRSQPPTNRHVKTDNTESTRYSAETEIFDEGVPKSVKPRPLPSIGQPTNSPRPLPQMPQSSQLESGGIQLQPLGDSTSEKKKKKRKRKKESKQSDEED